MKQMKSIPSNLTNLFRGLSLLFLAVASLAAEEIKCEPCGPNCVTIDGARSPKVITESTREEHQNEMTIERSCTVQCLEIHGGLATLVDCPGVQQFTYENWNEYQPYDQQFLRLCETQDEKCPCTTQGTHDCSAHGEDMVQITKDKASTECQRLYAT
jgi:hypothetical protein